MKRIPQSVALAVLTCTAAEAQLDLTGKWQAEVESGGWLQIWTLDLVQRGTEISGVVKQGIDDILPIESGAVRDDRVEFRVVIVDDRAITFRGEVDGEEIAFSRDVAVFEGGDPGGSGIFGERALAEFTARRVPDGESPKKPRGGPLPRQLTLYDRQGRVTGMIGEPGDYRWPALSPDGTKLAVVRPDTERPLLEDPVEARLFSVHSLLVFDLSSGESRTLTSAPMLRSPIWSPDGEKIAYFSYRDGRGQIHWRGSDASGREELLLQLPRGILEVLLDDFSSDGQLISFTLGSTLQVLSVGSGQPAVELLREEYAAYGAGFSVGADLFAYLSNERDSTEVYVRAFDAENLTFAGEPLAVGQTAGSWRRPEATDWRVHWRDDETELYYQNDSREIMAVAISSGPPVSADRPRLLFEGPDTGIHEWNNLFMTVGGDGETFVFSVPTLPLGVEVESAVLARYAGTYQFDVDPEELEVILKDGALWSRKADDATAVGPMIPVSQQSFYSPRMGEEIDFFFDDAGNVTHLIEYANGAGRKGVRK